MVPLERLAAALAVAGSISLAGADTGAAAAGAPSAFIGPLVADASCSAPPEGALSATLTLHLWDDASARLQAMLYRDGYRVVGHAHADSARMAEGRYGVDGREPQVRWTATTDGRILSAVICWSTPDLGTCRASTRGTPADALPCP